MAIATFTCKSNLTRHGDSHVTVKVWVRRGPEVGGLTEIPMPTILAPSSTHARPGFFCHANVHCYVVPQELQVSGPRVRTGLDQFSDI